MSIQLDTFDLYIPSRLCTYPKESRLSAFNWNDKLIQPPLINETTGEEIPLHHYADELTRAEKGQTYSNYTEILVGKGGFSLKIYPKSYLTTKEPCFVIEVTPKLIGAKYLEGVTRFNSRAVYEALMRFKVLEFSYDTFLDGYIADADFKIDLRFYDKSKAGMPDFKEAIKDIEENLEAIEARTQPDLLAHEHRFNRYKLNSGRGQSITFNDRSKKVNKGRSTALGKQHLMFYNKTLQLRTHEASIQFDKAHNITKNIKGEILRVEINAHTKYLRSSGYEGELTLREFLNFSHEFKLKLFTQNNPYLFQDVSKPIKVRKKASLSLGDAGLVYDLGAALEVSNGCFQTAATRVTNEYEIKHNRISDKEITRSARSKFKARCLRLIKDNYSKAISKPIQTTLNKELSVFVLPSVDGREMLPKTATI